MRARLLMIVLALHTPVSLVGCSEFPTRDEAKSALTQALLSSEGQREIAIRDVLVRLSNPESTADDSVVREIFRDLRQHFVDTGDARVLAAVDATTADAGFANYLCGFYRTVLRDERARAYYRSSERLSAIERCVGLSFSRADLNELLAAGVPRP